MPSIEIRETGRLDDRDSAFPQAVQLPSGDVLCSFSVGGGPDVHGGTELARSKDRGKTWTFEGSILPPTENPPTSNFLKLTLSPDGEWTVHYEGIMFDARAKRTRPDTVETGVSEFDDFAFGFPTAILLDDGTFLATHWYQEDGRFGIRWTKLRIEW